MGDLDTGRGTGGTRGVLQVGEVLGVEFSGDECRTDRVRHRVDGDDARAPLTRKLAQERVHRFGGAVGGQDDRRGGIGEHRVEAFGVAGQLGGEEGNRDVSGLNGGEESDDVVQTLRRQDRHAITRLGDLLQAGADRAHPGVQLQPAQFQCDTVIVAGEVQVAVGGGGAEFGDVVCEVGEQGGAGRKVDRALGVEIILNSTLANRHCI